MELTIEDFGSFDWQQIIENADKRECRVYSRLFFNQADKFGQEANQAAANVCILLGIVTSFIPNWDAPKAPYKNGLGEIIGNDNPEIVTFENWNILASLAPEIRDAELRARIADVLWVLKVGKFEMAQRAVDAYLEVARLLEDPTHWTQGFHRIERAFQLANQLGRNGEPFTKVIDYIEAVLDRLNGEDPLWFSYNLLDLLLKARTGDAAKYIALCEKIASAATTAHEWRRARDYLEIEARWLERANLDEDQAKVKFRAAETYIHEAQDLFNAHPPNYLKATWELADALEAMRRANAPKNLIDQVHRMLLEAQEKSAGQMERHSFTVDIGDYVNDAIKMIRGKSIRDAILHLAASFIPKSIDDLRQQVLRYKEEFPLQWFITSHQVNDQGRVTAIRPGISWADDKDTEEKAIRAEMYKYARHH